MQSAIVHFLLGGQVWLTCAAIVTIIALLDAVRFFDARPRAKRAAHFLLVLTLAVAPLTGTPLSLLTTLLVVPAVLSYAVLFGKYRQLALIAIAAAAIAFTAEARFFFSGAPHRPAKSADLIGDSISSGGFGETLPWHQQLGIPIRNLAQPSDTTARALRNQLPHIDPRSSVCVLEIGGNDMLDGVEPREFEANLDQILRRLSGRTLIMFELPVPPGRWRYGAIQRRLARRHAVHVVPKRILLRVLVDPQSTSDGLHLTTTGHQRLAAGVRAWLAAS